MENKRTEEENIMALEYAYMMMKYTQSIVETRGQGISCPGNAALELLMTTN